MIVYGRLVAALVDLDIADVAARAQLDVEQLSTLVEGGRAPSLAIRDRVARAIGANPIELFRLDDDLEEALAGAPSRFVTDAATLRSIDRHVPS